VSFLLGECVQAYLPLDEAQQREFERLVATESYQGVQAVNQTWFEKGRDQERRQILRELLEERFGPLPSPVQERIFQWPAERLSPLVKQILHAQSLRELGLED
jgi:hypothetical protein